MFSFIIIQFDAVLISVLTMTYTLSLITLLSVDAYIAYSTLIYINIYVFNYNHCRAYLNFVRPHFPNINFVTLYLLYANFLFSM